MKKRFRIKKIRKGWYRVEQWHTISGWDLGAACLCPKYNFSTIEEAEQAILNQVVEYNTL